jgi:hypothetical protein
VIRTSPDGIVWTARSSGTVQDLNGVTFADGQFVTQGNSGVILTSPNGVTWTAQSSGTGEGLATSAYGFGHWVAVGLNGTILSSTNAINWASHVSGTTALLLGVAAGPSTFVVVGDFGTILQSAGLAPVIPDAAYLAVLAGGIVPLEANARGAPPLTYHWLKDGIMLSGATNATLTLSDIPLSAAGSYSVVVSNTYGTATSVRYVLDVQPFLITVSGINSWPSNGLRYLEVHQGSDVNFAVGVQSAAPLTYQWARNGIDLPGQTGPMLNVTNVQFLNLFEPENYTVAINNRFGSTTVYFTLVVLRDLLITQGPQGQSAFVGSSVQLAVTAEGTSALTYQWTKNGTALAGATNATLIVSNATLSDSGSYSVVVRNASGSITSAPAILTVAPLFITGQPRSLDVRLGLNATFSLTVTSAVPVTYQWRFNGTDLPGANSPTLSRLNVQFADEGIYDVVVSNSHGTVISDPAKLRILVNLAITQAPLSQSVPPGGTATFSVAISGTPPPFSYEWRRLSPAPPFTNTFVLNERVSFFTLTNVQSSVTGSYRVVIRNAASPSGVSPSIFTLGFSADSDGDGLPDSWEATYPTAAAATGDADLDRMTNWQEYMAGTDPTNALSFLKVDRISRVDSTAIEFMAVSNKTYSVQYNDALGITAWSRLADIVARATNRVETVTDANANTNRYYRLVTPRQE